MNKNAEKQKANDTKNISRPTTRMMTEKSCRKLRIQEKCWIIGIYYFAKDQRTGGWRGVDGEVQNEGRTRHRRGLIRRRRVRADRSYRRIARDESLCTRRTYERAWTRKRKRRTEDGESIEASAESRPDPLPAVDQRRQRYRTKEPVSGEFPSLSC